MPSDTPNPIQPAGPLVSGSPLPPHPVLAHANALRKLLADRDRLTHVPSAPDDAEFAFLVAHKQRAGDDRFFSYRGHPAALKLLAMRCAWFGWLRSSWRCHWEHAGPLTPAGDALLRASLLIREAAGDADMARLRYRWFITEEEVQERQRQRQAHEARQLVLYAKRQRVIDANLAHQHRLLASNAAITALALKLGRSEINDIEGALEQLRDLVRQHDAERAWVNPETDDPA